METKEILAALDNEIERLQRARALLNGTAVKRGPGRPRSSDAIPATPSTARKKRRTLSAEARAKIAAAQKARWAKSKKASK